jgi:hypothetical protein
MTGDLKTVARRLRHRHTRMVDRISVQAYEEAGRQTADAIDGLAARCHGRARRWRCVGATLASANDSWCQNLAHAERNGVRPVMQEHSLGCDRIGLPLQPAPKVIEVKPDR